MTTNTSDGAILKKSTEIKYLIPNELLSEVSDCSDIDVVLQATTASGCKFFPMSENIPEDSKKGHFNFLLTIFSFMSDRNE